MQITLFSIVYLAAVTVPVTMAAPDIDASLYLPRELDSSDDDNACHKYSLNTAGQTLFTSCNDDGGMCLYTLESDGTCFLNEYVPTTSLVFERFVSPPGLDVVGSIVPGANGFVLQNSSLSTFTPSDIPLTVYDITIDDNKELQSVDFSLKGSVLIYYGVTVSRNPVLEELTLRDEPDSSLGALDVIFNPVLAKFRVDVSKLRDLQFFQLANNDALSSFSATLPESLTFLGIVYNSNLATLTIPNIPKLVPTVLINGNPSLKGNLDLDLTNATSLTTLNLSDNALTSVNLGNIPPSLVTLDLSGNTFLPRDCPNIPASVVHYSPPTGC